MIMDSPSWIFTLSEITDWGPKRGLSGQLVGLPDISNNVGPVKIVLIFLERTSLHARE